MKLPENRKERVQVFVLIGIGAALALYALVQLLVSPYTAARQKLNAVQEDLNRKIETARRVLLYAPAVKEEYESVTAEIEKTMASNVLRPVLGSYTVVVTETIETAARLAGIAVTEIQEVGTRELPRGKTAIKTAEAFKSYAVQVSGDGSYEQVRAFLDKIETDNPFLCVTEIRITGRSDKPEQHRVTIRVEWPIEATSADGKRGKP
jgi:hypothetical protein